MPSKLAYFLTGTDTDIGKTYVASQLLTLVAKQGLSCYGIKPVTAGCQQRATQGSGKNQWQSEDANQLKQAGNVAIPAIQQAPFLLPTPASPHIAASLAGQTLTVADISQQVTNTLKNHLADVIIIEGAGGWFTPINTSQTLADVAKQLNLPVILVVGIKLGGLNHAMLSVQAIKASGLTLQGYIVNEPEKNTPFFTEQVAWLKQNLPIPCLAVLRYNQQLNGATWLQKLCK